MCLGYYRLTTHKCYQKWILFIGDLVNQCRMNWSMKIIVLLIQMIYCCGFVPPCGKVGLVPFMGHCGDMGNGLILKLHNLLTNKIIFETIYGMLLLIWDKWSKIEKQDDLQELLWRCLGDIGSTKRTCITNFVWTPPQEKSERIQCCNSKFS